MYLNPSINKKHVSLNNWKMIISIQINSEGLDIVFGMCRNRMK